MQKPFQLGDQVTHMIYGDGTVVKTACLGSDKLYRVKFDEPKESIRMLNRCDAKDCEQISKKL